MTNEERRCLSSVYVTAFCCACIAAIFFVSLRFIDSIVCTAVQSHTITWIINIAAYCILFFSYTVILKATIFSGKSDSADYHSTLFFTAFFLTVILFTARAVSANDFTDLLPGALPLVHAILLSHI